MRLIDADDLLLKVRKQVLNLYGEVKDECAEHLDLDDDKAIFQHGLEQYLRIKFAYQWLKSEVEKSKTVDDTNEKYESEHKLRKDLEKQVVKSYQQGKDDQLHIIFDYWISNTTEEFAEWLTDEVESK